MSDIFWDIVGEAHSDGSDEHHCPSPRDLCDLCDSGSDHSDLETISHDPDEGNTASSGSTGWAHAWSFVRGVREKISPEIPTII